MNLRTLLTGMLAFCSLAIPLNSLTITSNGTAVPLPDGRGIPLTSLADGSRGYSLLESLPLMEEVYSIEIYHERGLARRDEEDLGERMGEGFLLPREGSWDLAIGGRTYRNIDRLVLRGWEMESRELTVWIAWEGGELLKEELDNFARLQNIDIEVIEVPKPDTKLISVARGGGEVPDLIMIQSSAVESLVQARAVQSLDYLPLEGFIPQGREAFTLDGRIWGLPFYYDTQVVLFNRDLLELPPGPWTLEDFEQAAASLRNSGAAPAAWNAYSATWLIPFQKAFGKDRLLEADGSIRVNDAPTFRALEYILELVDRDLLIPRERDAMDALFIQGETGMILTGSYAIPYFRSLGLNFGIKPYPEAPDNRAVSPLLDFKAFCITRKTDSPILARRVLQYLTTPGVQTRFCSAQNKLPVRRDIDPDFGNDREFSAAIENSLKFGTVIPPERVYRIYKNHMWKLIRFALSGRMSVLDVLEQGQRLMDEAR